MSNFWANRLGTPPQQAAPPPPPAPAPAAPNAPWWAPRQVAQPVTQQPVPLPEVQSVTPAEGATFSEMLGQEEYTSTKAQSAKDTERCPECESANYVAEKGKPNSMKHCFDCGYNPRFGMQSMAGISGTGQNIPTKTARVQTGNTSTWNPQQTITEHI